jgi:hypothetical protein
LTGHVSWRDQAAAVIRKVHAELGPNATYAERAHALRAAYPFGVRRYTPYKVWCEEQRKYLTQYMPTPAGPLDLRPFDHDGIAAALERTIEE